MLKIPMPQTKGTNIMIGAVVLLLVAVVSVSPVAPKVKDFLTIKLENTKEDSVNKVEVTIDDTEELNEASPSASTSATPTGTNSYVKEEKIDKTENGVHYEGTIKSSKTENHTDVTENGTRTVNNSNEFNSSTSINVTNDTGGNEGQDVNNGDSKVSIKINNNGDETTWSN
jgi:hypothetical protein